MNLTEENLSQELVKMMDSFESIPITVTELRELLLYLDHDNISICDNTFKMSREFLTDNDIDADRIIRWLEFFGGKCDCDLLIGVYTKLIPIIGELDIKAFPMCVHDTEDLYDFLDIVQIDSDYPVTLTFLKSKGLNEKKILSWFKNHGAYTDKGIMSGLKAMIRFHQHNKTQNVLEQ